MSLISNTIAGEEQRDLSYYFSSLTTDINPESKKPRVPAAQPQSKLSNDKSVPGVRVLFFLFLAVCQSPLVSSQWLL